jgi:hypothetical protein
MARLTDFHRQHQDRSVDFLYHTSQSIIHARLVIYITTWEINHIYNLDRTTVTVGTPRMLAMSTIPTFVVASSSLCPRSLLPLGPQGRREEYSATTRDSTVRI